MAVTLLGPPPICLIDCGTFTSHDAVHMKWRPTSFENAHLTNEAGIHETNE